jgi:hypothetical protein
MTETPGVRITDEDSGKIHHDEPQKFEVMTPEGIRLLTLRIGRGIIKDLPSAVREDGAA